MLFQPNSTTIVHSAGHSDLSSLGGFNLPGIEHPQRGHQVNTLDSDDEEASSYGSQERESVLINESELTPYDVICGRTKLAFNNTGNRRFRATITLAVERFKEAPERKDKSVVIRSVTDMLLGNGGRFLQQVNKNKMGNRSGIFFYALSKQQSRIKVGHALRDMALAASRAELSSVCPSHASKTVKASTSTSKLLHTFIPDFDPIADLEESSKNIVGDAVFESLVRRVAESNGDPGSKFIVTTPALQHTEGILCTAEGRDSLDANILSWLVDESTILLDF
jgi:hypothetical protein